VEVVYHEMFNELADLLGEGVPESKNSMTDFLAGISDPILRTGNEVVLLGNPVKLADFTECQQYLSTLAVNMTYQQMKMNKDRTPQLYEGGR
jgi:hypothetical protein